MAGILVPIAFFATIIALVYLHNRKKERMMMITRGMDPMSVESNKQNRRTSLKYGLLLSGVGLGFLLGNIMVATHTMDEEAAYFSMTFLFGGIALLIYHFAERNLEKENSNHNQDLEQ